MTLEIEVSEAWTWRSKNQNLLMDASKTQDVAVKTGESSWRGEDNIEKRASCVGGRSLRQKEL